MTAETENIEHDDIIQSDDVTEKNVASAPQAVSLCKAFRAQHVHGTLFTGGKIITTKSSTGIQSLRSNNDEIEMNMEEENVETLQNNETKENVTLLALSEGDISFIDTATGIQSHTIRTGSKSLANADTDITTYDNDEEQIMEDYNEDEMLDMDSVINFALSPNDEVLVTSSRNNLLRIYNLTLTKETASQGPGPSNIVQTISRAHESPIKAMEFHPSNAFLVTGAVDGVVKVWDIRSAFIKRDGKVSSSCFVTHCYRIGAGIVGGISALSWAPMHMNYDDSDPNASPISIGLAMGFESGRVDVVDLMNSISSSSSKKQKAITNSENGQDLTTTQSGGIVVVGGMEAHVSAVTDMTWAGGKSNDDFFVTVGRDEVVNIWSIQVLQTNDNTEIKKKKRRKVETIIPQLDSVTYKRIFTHPIYEQIESIKVLYSSIQSFHLVSAGSKGIIRIWDVLCSNDKCELTKTSIQSMKCIHTQAQDELPFGEERGGYSRLLLHPFSIDATSEDNFEKEMIAVDAHHNLTYFSCKSLSSKSGGEKKSSHEYSLLPGRTIVGFNDEIIDLKVLSQQNKIAVVTNSPQLRLFDFSQNSFSCYSTLNGHSDTILCMDVSADGTWIASAGKDRSMIIWDAKEKRQVAFASGHTEAIGAVALSRKRTRYALSGEAMGAFAVTASKDRTLKKWTLPSSDILKKVDDASPIELNVVTSVRAHEKDINIVTISPNDSLIATGSQDKTVKLWSSTDLSLQRTLAGHKRGIWDCQFSPIDRILATASGDRTLKLWSLSDGKCVRTFQGHSESVLRVRFLSGGLQLVSSGGDGLIKLWTIRTNECETTLDGHSEKVWALDTKADDTLSIVSGGADSRLIVWTDITKEREDEKRKAEEENVLMEQKLSNHLRFKEYEQALELALKLDKPHMALKVLTSLVENALEKQSENGNVVDTNNGPLQVLCRHVKGWSMSRIYQMLRYCRDWNTRARNSYIGMITIRAIFSSIPVAKLASNGDHGNIPELLAGIAPYAERHLDRLDKLYGSSYMVDFVLHMMGKGLDDDEEEEDDEVNKWLTTSKYVLPPDKKAEQKIQLKGVVKKGKLMEESDDEVVTIGDSDTESEGSFIGEDMDVGGEKVPNRDDASVSSSNSVSTSSASQ